MTDRDEEKPTLHEFLGAGRTEPFSPAGRAKSGDSRASGCETASASASASVGASSGGQGLLSWSSDLGRKRSNSDSAYMSVVRDRMLPVGSDSLECSPLMKMFRKEVVSLRLGRSHDDGMLFAMQPSPRPTSESVPVSPEPMLHYPSPIGQSGAYTENLSSHTHRDALISQTVADEGSRTGIKRSGIMDAINHTRLCGERNSRGVLTCSNRPTAPETIEPEPSNVSSRNLITSSSKQMTIFYGGQAHVFDDVHPNKADVIMALAGSNGGSWSTAYSPKSSVHPTNAEAKAPGGKNEMRINLALSRDVNHRLSIQERSDHGVSQFVQLPVAANPSNLTFGRAAQVIRPAVPAVEPEAEGKRYV